MAGNSWARAAVRFANWYDKAVESDLWFPPRLRSREWMFQKWGNAPYDRHRGFNTPAQVIDHIRKIGPHSCFYSTAYYEEPWQRKMAEKGWRGADLVFDLDGDHLDHVDPFNFPEMIEIIQEQAWLLWSEFLNPEFGFKEEALHVTFSGHRGFHLHYRSADMLGLDSSSRRELVNYIRGEGIDVGALKGNSGGGWRTRIDEGVEIILNKLDLANQDDAEGNAMTRELIAIIKERGKSPDAKVKSCGRDRMKKLADKVQHQDRRRRILQGNLKGLKQHEHLFLELVKGDRSLVIGRAGETDESVTIDIKRQIRWPGSLHGKCGLQVTDIPLERLDPSGSNPFDALSEAVPHYDDKVANMEVIVDRCVLRIGEDPIELSMGDEIIANANIESFLTLKGWAKVSNT